MVQFFLPNEVLWFITLILNFLAIIGVYRILGKLGLFVWIPIAVILANIQVVKYVELFGFAATLGNIMYAGSFLATDILSENYGKKEAVKGVGIGFLAILAMTVFMNISLYYIPHEEDIAHSHLVSIFSLMPRIAAASLLAYLVSQFHDVWAYDFWRKRFPSDKMIWLRNNASTMISQLLDSLLFVLVAFLGQCSAQVLLEILLTTYIMKWIVAVADTPFIYLAKQMHKKEASAISE